MTPTETEDDEEDGSEEDNEEETIVGIPNGNESILLTDIKAASIQFLLTEQTILWGSSI